MAWPLIAAAAASSAGSYFGQRSANKASKELVREQMAFQERMSNTSYQRAVSDMRLAGINPMLAYQQGGASTPSGAAAEMKSALGPAVNSAISVRRMTAEIESIKAGILKTRAETDAIRGRPGRILEPGVDVGVKLARDLIGAAPRHADILKYEIGRTSAKAVEGFKGLLMRALRVFSAPRR